MKLKHRGYPQPHGAWAGSRRVRPARLGGGASWRLPGAAHAGLQPCRLWWVHNHEGAAGGGPERCREGPRAQGAECESGGGGGRHKRRTRSQGRMLRRARSLRAGGENSVRKSLRVEEAEVLKEKSKDKRKLTFFPLLFFFILFGARKI